MRRKHKIQLATLVLVSQMFSGFVFSENKEKSTMQQEINGNLTITVDENKEDEKIKLFQLKKNIGKFAVLAAMMGGAIALTPCFTPSAIAKKKFKNKIEKLKQVLRCLREEGSEDYTLIAETPSEIIKHFQWDGPEINPGEKLYNRIGIENQRIFFERRKVIGISRICKNESLRILRERLTLKDVRGLIDVLDGSCPNSCLVLSFQGPAEESLIQESFYTTICAVSVDKNGIATITSSSSESQRVNINNNDENFLEFLEKNFGNEKFVNRIQRKFSLECALKDFEALELCICRKTQL
ncbi:MAG: hypothetical protein LBK29_00450 [Oscillospiraceae bacterium]|jgi:hypothetical protein|nr:hypothetical protein [Oscillospiraceae bacterium]